MKIKIQFFNFILRPLKNLNLNQLDLKTLNLDFPTSYCNVLKLLINNLNLKLFYIDKI